MHKNKWPKGATQRKCSAILDSEENWKSLVLILGIHPDFSSLTKHVAVSLSLSVNDSSTTKTCRTPDTEKGDTQPGSGAHVTGKERSSYRMRRTSDALANGM